MSWGTSGGTETKCPHCGAEWWSSFTRWYYDPKIGEVTSEYTSSGRDEYHDKNCPRYDGVSYEDVVSA